MSPESFRKQLGLYLKPPGKHSPLGVASVRACPDIGSELHGSESHKSDSMQGERVC